MPHAQTRVMPYSQAKVTLYEEVSGEGHTRDGGRGFAGKTLQTPRITRRYTTRTRR